MGIGVSILLLAVGAILTFAIHVTTTGFNINTIGVILMVVGAIGLLAALVIGGFGSFGGWTGVRRTTVVDDPYGAGAPPAGRRRVVRHETYDEP